MRRIIGKTVYEGIACGKIYVLNHQGVHIEKHDIQNAKEEWEKVSAAKDKAEAELSSLYKKAQAENSKSSADIIRAQMVMLADEEYYKTIRRKIEDDGYNAEYAVFMTGEDFSQSLESLEDIYLRERAIDVRDITARLLKCMRDESHETEEFTEPVILVAEDLTPSETIAFDKSMLLAIVTVHGSVNSHTAILARTMGIPALVDTDMELDRMITGMEAIVNGYTGEMILEPSTEQIEDAKEQIESQQKEHKALQALIGKEDVTKSGRRLTLCANAGNMEDVEAAINNDTAGIGLFRSEFLFLGRSEMPSEGEQFVVYKQALQKANGKKVVVRTLDIGADKTPEYIELDKEENPAMGFRAIRLCLQEEEILRTQLKALYRASVYGNLSIMYPMITSVAEVKRIQEISAQVKVELEQENIPFADIEEGIMIETPAAALISDELAEMVDFFSIGTNDLTQYTLAIDRQNGKLDVFYDSHHKAVLRMIELVTKNAHKAGKTVGICGELAADAELTEWFIDIGVDELSVVPAYILKMRQMIRQLP